MSWQPSTDPRTRRSPNLRRAGSDHRAAHPRSRRRLCGAARAAAWQAADGRAVHLLRPFRPGAVSRRQGHGRAAASAYRPRHRHLSVRRQHHASRQRGQHPGDPARRDELDDRGPRHRAFRAHPDVQRRDGQKMLGLQSWIALPAGKEEIAPSFQHYGAGDLPMIFERDFTARVIAGSAFGITSPVGMVSPGSTPKSTAQAGTSVAARPRP